MIQNSDIDAIENYLGKTTLSYAAMVTRYGKDVTKWPSMSNWRLAIDRLESLRPPAVPTPVISGVFAWDQSTISVHPDSDAMKAKILPTLTSLPMFLSADVAVVEDGDVAYTISGGSYTKFDPTVYAPANLKPGCSSDRHLVIVDRKHDRETDCFSTSISGTTIKSGGGGTFPVDSISEKPPINSNVAAIALRPGLFTTEDMLPDAKPHTLVFSCPRALIGGYPVFPSGWAGMGDPLENSPLHLAQMIDIDPTVDVHAISDPLTRQISWFIQECGMVLRDIGEGAIDVYGRDYINQGGNPTMWSKYGVNLSIKTGTNYPYAQKLVGFPWEKIRIKVPPTS